MGVLFRSAVRMSAGELACTYAALILQDDGQEINEEKIKTLLSAAKVDCESYWPGLFCKAINGAEGGIDQLVTKLPLAVATHLQLRRRPPLRRRTRWLQLLPISSAVAMTIKLMTKHSTTSPN